MSTNFGFIVLQKRIITSINELNQISQIKHNDLQWIWMFFGWNEKNRTQYEHYKRFGMEFLFEPENEDKTDSCWFTWNVWKFSI